MLQLILATSLLLLTTGVAGQLTIRSGLLIHGQPAVLYCSIPNFNDVGYWRKNGNQETRCDNAGFCAPITNTPYSFYSNATGIYLTIQTLTNTEQNVWTCAHAGYSTTTFTIDYNTNVFVVPDIITVTGMERNVTMEDDATLLLDVETACMNPQPIISLGYENGSNSFTLPFEIQNSSTTPCPTGGSIYTRELVISSDILCASTILPHVLVTPEGLPEGYSGKQWVSSNYLTFPTCKGPQQLTSDAAFGYFVLFTLLGLLLGGVFAYLVFRLLVYLGKLPMIILEATEDLSVKLKLYTVSSVTSCILCMIIAAIVVVVDCQQTECKNLNIGVTVTFMIPGIVFQMIFLAASVHIYGRCCMANKNGVKRLEEDRTSDHVHHNHNLRSVTITPSAIEVDTKDAYSKNPDFYQEPKKTRSESLQSGTSTSLKADRSFVTNTQASSKRTKLISESEASVDLTTDRYFINSKMDKNNDNPMQNNAETHRVSDSGYTSTNQDTNKLSESNSNLPHQSEAPRASTPTNELEESSALSESSDESIKDGGLSPDIYRKEHKDKIWSTSKQREGTISPEVILNGHVTKFKSNDQSKVMITPDNLSCIISVPTGDEHDALESSGSSTDDDVELEIGEKKKKGSKKKRVKKKGWKKKKQAVAPESSNNTENTKKKKKKATKIKKSKIIV